MSVFKAMANIENYLTHCPSEKTRAEAKKDFTLGIKEIIKLGYTWGRNHKIPFDYSKLNKEDLGRLLRFVEK